MRRAINPTLFLAVFGFLVGIGYRHFFVWVMLATLPGFLVVAFVPLDAEFGRKTHSAV